MFSKLKQTAQGELTYVMSLEKIQKIALNGISRASYFARFAASMSVDYKTYTVFRSPDQALQMEAPPLAEEHFNGWHNAYVDWVFCNSVNEVVEKFYNFLEFVVVMYEMEGQRIPFKAGDNLFESIKGKQEAIRDQHEYYHKARKYLKKLGVALSDEDDKIVWGFTDIRNLLTHNGGVVEHRRNLGKDEEENVVLSWYYAQVFATGEESGKEYALSEMPLPEGGWINMRPKKLKTKTFPPGSQMAFTYSEVQEICWTFYLIVMELTQKSKEAIEKRQAARIL